MLEVWSKKVGSATPFLAIVTHQDLFLRIFCIFIVSRGSQPKPLRSWSLACRSLLELEVPNGYMWVVGLRQLRDRYKSNVRAFYGSYRETSMALMPFMRAKVKFDVLLWLYKKLWERFCCCCCCCLEYFFTGMAPAISESFQQAQVLRCLISLPRFPYGLWQQEI